MEEPMRERSLAELRPAERPRYFYGKRLTADDLQKEQEYGRAKRQLHNRFGLGQGVVCGLRVTPLTTPQGDGVSVSAGLALDAFGREIVVPTDLELVPLLLTDDCDPGSQSDGLLPPSVHLSVCYRELAGGSQPVSGANPEADADAAHAGTIIESYCLRVREGAAPDASTREDAELLELVRRGRFHDALCGLAATACPPAPADPCVVLANIAVGGDGSLTIDACRPRAIVPTNRLLLRLVQSLNPGDG